MIRFIVSILIILTSCSRNYHTDELQKIDSLKMVLDETELIFKEINIDSLRQLYIVFKKNTDQIKKSYSKEDDEGWNIICRYSDLKNPLRNSVEYYDNIQTELVYSHHQLDSLKYDLQNNTITSEIAKKYLNDEEKAVAALQKIISGNLATSKIIIEDFDSLNRLAENVISKCKKKEVRSEILK
jgi:hypothetical protein